MTRARAALAFLLVGAAACAIAPYPAPRAPRSVRTVARVADPDAARGRILEVAQRELGSRFAGDCSGWIRHVMHAARVDLGPLPSARSMTESLSLASVPVSRPRPGDLVFFHDTYDRDGSGKLGQLWTHVSLVESVSGDAATLLHRGGSGIVRIRIDLARPHDDVANDAVRVRTAGDPRGTRYLAAELFAGWGDVVER